MFEHRRMSGASLEVMDKHNLTPVEIELKNLIANFVQLQNDRYEADYNIAKIWPRTDVTRTLDRAHEVFSIWRRIRKDKQAQFHLMSMFGARR